MSLVPKIVRVILALVFSVSLPLLARGADLPQFSKGINLARLHNLAHRDPERPGKFLWPPFRGDLAKVSDAELKQLKDLGFDFIRLPVAPAPFLTVTEAESRILTDKLFDTVKRLQDHGFAVLLDPHPGHGGARFSAPRILSSPSNEEFEAYLQWLEGLARHMRRLPGRKSALGLMNEPQADCHHLVSTDWTDIQPLLYRAVRDVAPDLAVVLTGGCWSSHRALGYLDMAPYDENTIVDVHYYSPHYFTHQALPFASEPTRYLAGLAYPGADGNIDETLRLTEEHIAHMRRTRPERVADDALSQAKAAISRYYDDPPPVDRAYISGHFDIIRRWAGAQNVDPARIVIGEFGAARPPAGLPAIPGRNAWIRDVREEAEASGFAWAYWDYNAGSGYPGFGLVFDNESRTIDPDMVKALGLDETAISR
ncbi:cellulase family glycosylhydrolase [Rhizobiales bacterium]|uniref:glycoside hydrolase family 5 protein n=1 Tax=Hongsoonwoonella zoysiae TaxID=2821844 RepID=UPI00155F77C5|nr:cellulase family glycosylhydrolase [Hongsoonwoonella zoysiae]NRG16354.1 cellulase family glycosylhydrolase [Hongsoonwoonella zoysiae]